MVSRRVLAASAAAVLGAANLLAQITPPAGQTRTPEPQGGLAAPPPEPSANLTPERRADILMARKMYREAIDTYQQALVNNAVIWNKIGIAYHQMTQLESAQRYYEMAIKLNPKYSEAINNLGTVYYARKNYRKATSYYKKALEFAPKSASIYSNLGTVFFARKKYKEAMDAYAQALALDPDVFEHRSSYGSMLQERSVEERAKFHYYLAKSYAQAGMNDRALLYLRKALEEGFREREKMAEDPEFNALRDTPEFQELMKLEPRVL